MKLLFVCHGNICRSPMAEFVMKDLLRQAGRTDVAVESAALHTDELGNDIHRGTRLELTRHGIPYTPRTAWLLSAAKAAEYDLIIIDSSDPYGPAEGLFTREFYGTCFKALRDDGILINQHESPFYAAHQTSVKNAHAHIAVEFPVSTVYQCHIPSYPSGHWLFGFASKKYHPIGDLDEMRWNRLGIRTRYYNTELHRGAFALPNYVRELLKS